MLDIKNVSLRSLSVALRWARIHGKFSNNIREWTKEESDILQGVCEEYDRRKNRKISAMVTFTEIH